MRDNMGLYHAKRTYNGKWVEGCLVVTPQGDAYIISTAETKRDVNVLINQCSLNVDPETVGQYTGLTDKNGKRIFEGDVVITRTTSRKFTERIEYSTEYVRFVCITNDGIPFPMDSQFKYEVIGNIHDNPELLE